MRLQGPEIHAIVFILLQQEAIPWEQIPYPHPEPFLNSLLTFARAWSSEQQHFSFLTSGSTGQPTVINISRGSMHWVLKTSDKMLHWSQAKTQLLALEPTRIGGAMAVARAMEARHTVILWPPGTPFNFTWPLSDWTSLVPFQLQKIMEHPDGIDWAKKSGCFLLGGAPLSNKLEKKLIAHAIKSVQSYGMTETASMVALRSIYPTYDAGFKPLPGVSIRIDSDQRIHVKSPSTNQSWLETHDLAEWLTNGDFMPIGRNDDTVNSGGKKWPLALLDSLASSIIEQHADVSDYFFWKVPDDKLGEALALAIEKKSADPLDVPAFLQHLSEVLPKHAIPRHVNIYQQFIREGNHKINRRKAWEMKPIFSWKK